ncbi:MAG: hypothetical protein P0Y53_23430 [Candidatus Pseudobacter hemicellulosilyticus]|uniref:Long-subunit fatty acid transport protein n=1 Tax=Candidatus Pseudobacter hemicellulosilyticus TaxID=3121375 RepID=A0AAJ5WRJ3_9BACT|nr:MAG: hypothetical protein P0Y53_23430 [Pseudobacter sp.]
MQKVSVSILLLLALWQEVSAQDINAPYSTYGIGDIDFRYYDKSAGMSGTSMALLSTPSNILFKNPASLSGLERSNVLVNGVFVGKTVKYTGDPIGVGTDNTARDFAVKHFSVAMKLNKHWASAFSITPFSYVSYSYRSNLNVEGAEENYGVVYEGDGGLYNVGWTNSFQLNRNFSLGVRSSFIFGSINQTESLESSLLTSSITTKKTDYYHNFRFELGGLYQGKLSKKTMLSLGGKVTTKSDLNRQQSLLMTEGSTEILNDKVVETGKFTLPWSYDMGLAVTNNGRTTYAVDYSYEDWASSKMKGNYWSLVNSQRLSAGIQFSQQVEAWNRRFEKSYWQFGGFVGRSYLRVKNEPIEEFGGTVGYGGYAGGRLAYGISLEAGRRGTTNRSLIREDFVQLTLRFSYREFLYSKGRKYD